MLAFAARLFVGFARPTRWHYAPARLSGPSHALSAVEIDALVEAARVVRPRAYAPYSGFQVGAALLGEDGRIYAAVNVENAAYPSGLCAEHAAVGVAVAAGVRRFRGLAVVTAPNAAGEPGSPCGKCRQVLSEFGLDLPVLLAAPSGPPTALTLRDLLPRAFSGQDL